MGEEFRDINRQIDRQIENYNAEICRGPVLNKDILGLKGCRRGEKWEEKNDQSWDITHRF